MEIRVKSLPVPEVRPLSEATGEQPKCFTRTPNGHDIRRRASSGLVIDSCNLDLKTHDLIAHDSWAIHCPEMRFNNALRQLHTWRGCIEYGAIREELVKSRATVLKSTSTVASFVYSMKSQPASAPAPAVARPD
nr:hypothetical protein CFP56_73786 [Quercus suber]